MSKYTPEELDNAAVADLLNDARCSEIQADEGPFYPERGITRESLLAYAMKCRGMAQRREGAHAAVLKAWAAEPVVNLGRPNLSKP